MFYISILYFIIYLSLNLLTIKKKKIEDHIDLGYTLNFINNREIIYKRPSGVVNYEINTEGGRQMEANIILLEKK